MSGLNIKVRLKNPVFWIGLIGAVGSTILAYMGMAASDLTTWDSVGDIVVATFSNPYLFGLVILTILSFVGVIVDPTTRGVSDSARAMTYEEPR